MDNPQGNALVARKMANAKKKQDTSQMNSSYGYDERQASELSPPSASFTMNSSQAKPKKPAQKTQINPNKSQTSAGPVDWYSRPDLDAMAEAVAQQALQREKEGEYHKQALIQMNRERCLTAYQAKKAQRLELEARCGITTSQHLFDTYHIQHPQQRDPAEKVLVRKWDHNAPHKQFLDANRAKVNQQLNHRMIQLSKLKEKQQQRALLEESLGTVYSKAKQQKQQQLEMAATIASARSAPSYLHGQQSQTMAASMSSRAGMTCPPLPRSSPMVGMTMADDEIQTGAEYVRPE
eukprot:TRINITY_DN59509_c0_g1_i1.p2 TRINITY_DN59509_c0_g1~~TRINITY_DN59509_c0_g1_i1.p2  ORF type:complete len:293 (+),score=28.39 TRINITY_DN59509_c0_g1_i1:86-964(+)